jgi:hypothetical protein
MRQSRANRLVRLGLLTASLSLASSVRTVAHALGIAMLTAGASGLPRPAAPKVTATSCRSADSTTVGEIAYWKTKMHSSDPLDSADVSHASLLYVADSAFAVVTDSTLCANVLAAHNSENGYTTTELSNPASATVYAIRVGRRYISWNPDFRSGEYVNHAVWDSSLAILSHYF